MVPARFPGFLQNNGLWGDGPRCDVVSYALIAVRGSRERARARRRTSRTSRLGETVGSEVARLVRSGRAVGNSK